MEKTRNGHIIAIDGGKKNPVKEDGAYIVLDQERINLSSFVLSGENEDGRRILLTFNTSPDEICSFVTTLQVVMQERIKRIMDIE